MNARTKLLQHFKSSNTAMFDQRLAKEFSVGPLAAFSTRTVVEHAAQKPGKLADEIEAELLATPGLVGPVPNMARYLGATLTDG